MTTPATVLPWRRAWIIGASSGIGAALARRLADGGVAVVISARSADKLAAVAAGSTRMTAWPLDVTDRAAVARGVHELWDADGGFDLVVINPGIWLPMGAREFTADKVRRSLDVNVTGPAEVLEAVLPRLIAQGRGHVALTASVAGYRGLPGAAAYAGSKAAAIAMAEALRPDLARYGVTMSVINPGFVETPMTAVNDFPMPFMISAEAAATHIVKGLSRRRFEIVFPWQMMVAMKALRLLPYGLYFAVTRRMVTGTDDATRR